MGGGESKVMSMLTHIHLLSFTLRVQHVWSSVKAVIEPWCGHEHVTIPLENYFLGFISVTKAEKNIWSGLGGPWM